MRKLRIATQHLKKYDVQSEDHSFQCEISLCELKIQLNEVKWMFLFVAEFASFVFCPEIFADVSVADRKHEQIIRQDESSFSQYSHAL